MTVGTISAPRPLVVLILALVPLLMAIAINFPAQAGSPATEAVNPGPEAPPPATGVSTLPLDLPGEALPAATDGPDYVVILDTGVEIVGYESGGATVVGYESGISALAVVAITELDSDQLDAEGTDSGD